MYQDQKSNSLKAKRRGISIVEEREGKGREGKRKGREEEGKGKEEEGKGRERKERGGWCVVQTHS